MRDLLESLVGEDATGAREVLIEAMARGEIWEYSINTVGKNVEVMIRETATSPWTTIKALNETH